LVVLNKIYTRTGDDGTTALGSGERRPKYDLRVAAYGTVDEANAAIGFARTQLRAWHPEIDTMLSRVQNDLFDLGADLATPDTGEKLDYEPLRILAAQVERLERDIDGMTKKMKPLRSFVLPGGTPGAAALHMARTASRRAERLIVELSQREGEKVSAEAIRYINRVSDLLFVAARAVNDNGEADVLWVPGANR
jgi:cob(I)alamin adenosyltransferase